jgi:SAM-dependent methyltransferase
VDISRDKIEKLKKHLEDRKIQNVAPIVGEENNPHLPSLTLDAVLIVDTYHEMDAHQEILQNIKEALKTGGRLVICEPISDERKKLSREEQERKHELGIRYALDDLKRAGFKIISQQEGFVDRVKEKGDKMWLIVCERSN